MLQAYISNISSILDVFYSKCFIFAEEESERRRRRSPLRGRSPRPCAGVQQHASSSTRAAGAGTRRAVGVQQHVSNCTQAACKACGQVSKHEQERETESE
jgi:hypothetical protein